MFLHANVFGREKGNKINLLAADKFLNANKTFNEIKRCVEKQNKQVVVSKNNLNTKEFEKILSQKPKVLLMYCHGGYVEGQKKVTQFSFENEDRPYLELNCDEKEVRMLLESYEHTLPDVIVLNTCHS